jgi:predicted metal-binding membrane protein
MPFKVRSASSPDGILIGLLAAMVLLAWFALWLWGNSAYGHVLLHGSRHPGTASQNAALFAVIFVISWTLMTVAMMLPTSIPLIVLFHRMVRDRKSAAWLVTVLLCGYVGTWALCGVLLQLANRTLRAGFARLSWLAAAPWIGGAVIIDGSRTLPILFAEVRLPRQVSLAAVLYYFALARWERVRTSTSHRS